MNKTVATPFIPHRAHRAMTSADAQVFNLAAQMYVHPQITKAIRDAGGDEAHFAHFSRTKASGRPIAAFAAEFEHDTIVLRLNEVAEGLSNA